MRFSRAVMNGLEIAAVITALGGFVGVVGALLINARKIDDLQKHVDEYKQRESLNRTDLIAIGEQLANTRADAAKLALVMDQLFRYYRLATGQDPPIDMAMLQHMREIYYITNELPAMSPNEIAVIQRQQQDA